LKVRCFVLARETGEEGTRRFALLRRIGPFLPRFAGEDQSETLQKIHAAETLM
jgi:hypothetical protein